MTMNNLLPHTNVVIVADEPDRLPELVGLVDEEGLVPEIFSPEKAPGIELPIRAAILCVHDPTVCTHVLEEWAHRRFQPLTAVMLYARRGASELEARARDAGFLRFTHVARTRGDLPLDALPGVRDTIRDTCREDHSLVPLIARQLGALTSTLAHLFAAAFDDPPIKTVPRWVERIPPELRDGIDGDLRRLGLGGPKRVLCHLKLLRAVYVSCSSHLTPDAVAERTGYASGKYLGWVARSRTGASFRDLDIDTTIRVLFSPEGVGRATS